MITTKRIFYGFIRNYSNLDIIGEEQKLTTWTFKSMQYFNKLGTMLGYYTEFEGNRYDHSWYDYDHKRIILHVEHENQTNADRINHTIHKLLNSKSLKTIGIVYPEEQDFAQLIKDFKKKDVEFTARNQEIMIIFMGALLDEDRDGFQRVNAVRKYYNKSKEQTVTSVYDAKMKEREDGTIYIID